MSRGTQPDNVTSSEIDLLLGVCTPEVGGRQSANRSFWPPPSMDESVLMIDGDWNGTVEEWFIMRRQQIDAMIAFPDGRCMVQETEGFCKGQSSLHLYYGPIWR